MKLLGSAAAGAALLLAAGALPAGPAQAMPFDATVGTSVDDLTQQVQSRKKCAAASAAIWGDAAPAERCRWDAVPPPAPEACRRPAAQAWAASPSPRPLVARRKVPALVAALHHATVAALRLHSEAFAAGTG